MQRGKHGGSLNIHQALWAPGIQTQEEAVSYSNRLMYEAWQDIPATQESGAVLDLGCGIGSSLLYLVNQGIKATKLNIRSPGMCLAALSGSRDLTGTDTNA
ncbi:MAG: hypothetical protein AAFV07_15905, partial [Bacteroidota bacterium]